MTFINDKFMLNTKTAQDLYQKAKTYPIFDYHCHLNPKEIYEDKPYSNIVDLWLAGDHYKWRAMRANGISEKYITGDGTYEERFKAWAETVENLMGNPLYHWTHLEMKQVFNIDEVLNSSNWKKVYDMMNNFIIENSISPKKLINNSNVKFIGTTDAPLDDLEYHKKIFEDKSFKVTVSPTFRPDEAFVEHKNFVNFVKKLGQITNRSINNYEDFLKALEDRINYFVQNNCCITDHGFLNIIHIETDESELNNIFNKAMNKEELTLLETQKWQTMTFKNLCKIYAEKGLVVQVHFGVIRNNNSKYFEKLGVDTGFDSMIDQTNLGIALNSMLDSLYKEDSLPKMIFYNLNPIYNILLANTIANFQNNQDGIKSKIQFGAAWWFNDTKLGMISQLEALSEQGILANFVGMLTDSRSFLSYQRHDYFRRILCNYVANWLENGEIPNDKALLHTLVEKICYSNSKNYFKRS